MALKPIQILINAKDNASGVFDSLKAKIIGVGAAVASYFTVDAFVGAVRGAADLEAKLSEVQAVSGATAAEMRDLRTAAEQAGSSTVFTATEAAGALGELTRAGLSASEAIKALKPTLLLAQAGNIGLEESATLVTRGLSGFGLAADEAGRFADVLALAANASNTSVTGLGQALSYAAPTAVSLGLSLETTVALVGKLADAGIDASRAGTALNSIFSQFSNPASLFRKELAAAGITTGNFSEALRQLEAAGPRGSKAILAVGQEAGPALRSLLNQGVGSIDELIAKLQAASGSASSFAQIVQNNLRGELKGLGSAWESLNNTLATPILPVLREAVDSLAQSFRSAVSDGTIGRFGESIAIAFRNGVAVFKEFAAQVNFENVGSDLRAFATRSGEVFEQIGTYAKNGANSVQLAYGVMSAGSNAVLAAITAIGSGFAELTSNVFAGVSKLQSVLATITFGGVSERFKQAAQESANSAGAFAASAQALRDSALQSLEDTVAGAETARNAWEGLTASVENSAPAAVASKSAMDEVVKTLQQVAEKTAAAQQASDQKAQADAAATQAVALLRGEYANLIASGNLQEAALKFEEINAALGKTPAAAAGASAAAKATAEDISAAFERAGIKTKEDLALAAQTAKSDFELIKASGQATSEGLAEAFQKYAQAAIAANGGVATDAIRAQAAMLGLEAASDSAGKTIVRSMSAGASAAKSVTTAVQGTTSAIQEQLGFLDRLAKRNAEVKSTSKTDAQGFSAGPDGNRIVAGTEVGTLTGIAAFLKNAGVQDDATARRIALEFSDGKGNIPYIDNPGQKKYGGDTLTFALLKAAEKITFGGTGVGGNTGAAVGSTSIPKPSRDVNVNVTIGGNSYGRVTTDDAGADVLQNVLGQLGRARRSSV